MNELSKPDQARKATAAITPAMVEITEIPIAPAALLSDEPPVGDAPEEEPLREAPVLPAETLAVPVGAAVAPEPEPDAAALVAAAKRSVNSAEEGSWTQFEDAGMRGW
ncbi:hypothetical protein NUW54_g12075 [Trametes sanguinea]|uniref:Uncharacterized protein n=1 Tax=Trametes sanguinea TaxID=158606 RepID=A0ACC1N2T6_9APHY|nr:hypothetical protein NUW54_g12075 [Trametes sanguinea]